MRRLFNAWNRIRRITSAFLWLGASETTAYPMQLVLNSIIGPTSVPIIYYFVAQLIDNSPDVGSDYYTFVMIGFVTMNFMNLSLQAFSGALNRAVQQGQFETYLVQPVSWYTLPFALAAWPIVMACVNATVMGAMALLLGFQMNWDGLPLAALVLVLGMASSHAIGTLAASVRLLSKRADPVVALYTLLASILSGTFFPVTMLPGILQPIAKALPLTYVISAERLLLMKQPESLTGPSITTSIVALSLITISVYAVSLFSFGRALDFGRRYGVIGDY